MIRWETYVSSVLVSLHPFMVSRNGWACGGGGRGSDAETTTCSFCCDMRPICRVAGYRHVR